MKSKSTWWGTRSTVLGSGSPTSYHLSCWVVAEIAEISASDYKFKLPGCVVYLRYGAALTLYVTHNILD